MPFDIALAYSLSPFGEVVGWRLKAESEWDSVVGWFIATVETKPLHPGSARQSSIHDTIPLHLAGVFGMYIGVCIM